MARMEEILMTNPKPASVDSVTRAIDFVNSLQERYRSYHDHKESMAYAGLTAFTTASVVALVSSEWPPASWGGYSRQLGVIALMVFWLGVFVYLRFQLRRRRWAALRMAGCERLLGRWNP
jgi:hypothetical protein